MIEGNRAGRSALARHMRMPSAMAPAVAIMIGAGIFTTTEFQASDLGHPLFIFALWIVGGVLALLGALCCVELGAMMSDAGAEYVNLRETYGPAVGFMSAFISLVAGFSAAVAAAYVAGEMMSPRSGISSTTGSWSSTGNGTELRFPPARRPTPALPVGRPLQTLSAASLILSSRNAPFGHTSGPGLKAP